MPYMKQPKQANVPRAYGESLEAWQSRLTLRVQLAVRERRAKYRKKLASGERARRTGKY